MSEQDFFQGSCQCGSVEYTVTGKMQSFFLCHCSRCQKDSGSAHGANVFVKSAELRYVKGQEDVAQYTVPDTNHRKYFGHHCGCPVAGLVQGYPLVQIPAGSLDQHPELTPTAQIFMGSRASWVDKYQVESCQKFEGLPK